MNSQEAPPRLTDYWSIVVRRKFGFLVPFGLLLAATAAVAFLLPPIYRSEATFLVQRQSVPTDMVQTTVNSYVEEQIAQIRQRLVSRSNLLEIAEKFDLYGQERATDVDEAFRKLRDDVEVEMVDIRASDPDRPGQRITTIAFTVAFHADTAEKAMGATNELAERFLAEHQSRRDEQAAEVSVFLEAEAEDLESEIALLEEKLAGFKQEELRQLPELMNTNLRLFEKTEQDIQNTEESIRALREKQDVTRAELSLTPPYRSVVNEEGDRILTGSERLSVLTAEYFRAASRYSAQHPDIVRLTREIRILGDQMGNEMRVDEMLSDLVNLQEQLREARQKYADAHPEVQRLERAVAALQRGFQDEVESGVTDDTALKTPPDNPRYVALKTQLDSTELALEAEQKKLFDLRERLAKYEDRLYQTPSVERDFKMLTRNYDTLLQQHAELRRKQRDAELARNLESGQSGEKFVLASGAYLPVLPDSPNRIGIGLLGFLLAVSSGLGAVAVAEVSDRTVRNAGMVAARLGMPPLVVIPRIAR